MIKLHIKKKGRLAGVIVREGEDGVFPIERSLHVQSTKEYTLDDGEVVLDANQFEDLMDIHSGDEKGDEADNTDNPWTHIDRRGVLSLEDTVQRGQAVEGGDDVLPGNASDHESDEKSESGSGTSSGSSSSEEDAGSCSDSVGSKAAGKVVAATALKRRRQLRKGHRCCRPCERGPIRYCFILIQANSQTQGRGQEAEDSCSSCHGQ